jgi:hypothetical protein
LAALGELVGDVADLEQRGMDRRLGGEGADALDDSGQAQSRHRRALPL